MSVSDETAAVAPPPWTRGVLAYGLSLAMVAAATLAAVLVDRVVQAPNLSLAVNLGRTVGHKDLLRAVWGSERADIQYLRVYVGQLRQKLAASGPLLASEPGVGYRLEAIS
jgi:hypothetical protein